MSGHASVKITNMKFLNGILRIFTTLLLFASLVAIGFVAVAVPDWATIGLSNAFSGCDQPNTPFTKSELCDMAVAGKHYTFDTNNAEELTNAINKANESAVAEGRSSEAKTKSEQQSLDAEAISHLDDVYQVVSIAKPILAAIFTCCVLAMIYVGKKLHERALGTTLLTAGILVLAVFAFFGIWAAIDFYGMFNMLHGLFFASGTWTFAMDSLLITMYPLNFWMGMGGIWLAITCILSILAIVIGMRIRK